MAEIFDEREVREYLRAEVEAAGGAKKWLKKNKMFGYDHVLHMVANGDAATTPRILEALGFRRVDRFEPINRNIDPKAT